MGKGVDLGVLAGVALDSAEASKRVLAVDVHGTRAADTLAAGTSERERGVHLVLDLDQRVQDLSQAQR